MIYELNDVNTKKTILVVDDSVMMLFAACKALEDDYVVVTAKSSVEALEILTKTIPVLILLDIEMPGINGFETLKLIKNDKRTKDTPVIFLTGMEDSKSELEGLRLGAVDYVKKPFSAPTLLQRVKIHISLVEHHKRLQKYNDGLLLTVNEQTEIITELHHAIINMIGNLIECRDGFTGGHVERTQHYLKILVDGLKHNSVYINEWKNTDIDLFVESALLHDVGKIGIPDSILNKPASLTKEEFEIIKKHTTIGEKAIRDALEKTRDKKFLQHAAIVAITHHEKWDGSGYPNGLAGENIPLIGRLMAVADVYDALVSVRPYKNAYTHDEAVRIIANGSGTQFDPLLVDIFMSVEKDFVFINK